MFEAQVAYYLNKYLGQYVEGIDQRSLTISIYAGNVVLKNLRFKPDALADFDLPITVTAGLLGSLTLKVPWSNLGRQPVEVSIDRLYILAKPKKESDVDVGPAAGKNAKESHEALEAAFQKAKLQRVKRQEARWIDDIKEMENKKAGSSAGRDGPQPSHGGAGAFIRGLIDTIIGNLQLSITNLHVRYEDDVTNKGHPFACGVTLESIAGFTVDDLGRQAFVTSSPLDLLRKAFVLRRIALYFDCETPPWKPKRSWHALSPVEWQGWFQPGIAAEDESQVARQYVLHPVDGRSTYVRRGRNVKRKEEEPASEIELNLDSVAIGLTQPQYRSYSLLLSEVSTYTARLPQVGYRPKERPAPGVRARIWWHYAWLAIRQQREAHQMPWSRVIWCAQMQRKYISAYIRHLKQEKALLPGGEQNPTKVPATGGDGGEGQAGGMQEITSMETSLPENTILMFRRIAYVELERERRKEERSGKSRTTKGQESTVGGWLGWLVGSRQSKPGESEGRTEGGSHIPVLPAADEENLGEQRSDLSEEEYTKLLELVERQEEGLKLSVETPYTLLTSVRVSIGVASAALRGNDDSLILGGSLEGIYAGVDMYPTTSQFQVEVTSMGMDGIDGVFIRTGATKAEPQEMDRASSLVAELRQVTDVRALSAKFVQKPQDKSADAVLEVVLLPSYVLYSAATVNSVTEFFKTPEEEEQLDFTGLTAAAASQLERARRMAAEYAAAALSNKPRLKMKLDLEAPKISIPVQDAEGEVSVALDLGRFIIESDAKTAASLPSEEAGLYECIRLSGRNVSVYVVDGMFDWAELSTEADVSVNLVPVLQRCKLEVGVQAARYPDPKFPRLRLFPTIPMLHFHISPGRLSRMLRVMHAVVSAPSSPAVTSPSALPSSSPEEQRRSREAWRLHADCQGPLKLLTWTGIGRSTASWVSRYSLLYRGKMYIYKEGKETEKATEVITTWPDRVVLRVPPEHVRGANNVLAVRPSGPAAQDMAHVMEDSDTWLLRLGSESEASKWYRQLLATQHRLDEEVQGQGQSPLEIDWDASSVSTSLADESEEAKPPGATQGQATGDHPAVVPSPPVLIELDAQLGECAIFASGREPGQFYWPPPTEAQSVEDSRLATRLAEKNGSNERGESSEWDSKQLDNEICLVIVRATQGSLGIKYGDFGMTIHTSLGSFEIRDMLLGKRSPSKCFLACSSIIGEGAMAVEDEIFFDPVEADQSVPESQTPRTPRTPLGRQPSGKQDLAEFTFALRRPGFPEYQGTDSTLDIKLNRLYFFCNRPTVAALISMGMDLGVAMSKGFGQSQDSQGSEETSADKLGQAESIASAADQGAMQTTSSSAPSETEFDGEGSISDVLAREDGERTMFALNLSLEMVQVVFNYEGYEDVALVSAGINNFTFKLATAPDGAMYITSSLGNLVAEDCTLEQNHPYRQACGLRAGRSVSLVEVGFDFHPRGHYDERVPKGMEFYSLRARLSELQLVFLYRLVQQVTQYLVTMLAMRLPEDKGVSLSTGQQPAQSTEGTGARPEEPINEHAKQQQPMLLVMDIEMDAPIITVPASSDSLDALDVDLGILHLRTSVIQNAGQEQGEGEKETGLFEKATLTFSGVGCSVIQAGVGGHSIIKNPEQGWKVQWQRSLDAENRGNQPFFALALDVPFIRASLTDSEYALMTSVAASNVSETPRLPSGAQWVEDHHLTASSTPPTRPSQPPSTTSPSKQTHEAVQEGGGQSVEVALKDRSSIRVVVSLGELELELKRTVAGLQVPSPLARFSIAELNVAYRTTDAGAMFVETCIPKLEARDLRPEVPVEQSLVISSGHKASFCMLTWAASPGMKHQSMDITLQKPLVVAELGFLLSVTYFFVPSFSFVKSSPVEYVSYDILLSAKTPYLATGDIYLSPTVRLLADGDCGEQPVNFEFDGRGYNLVLPPPSALGELLPLILIGTHGTLRLRNVTIVNAESLPDVLQLATGSQLLTQEEDGVRMERGMPAELGPGFSSSGENPSSLEEGKLSIPEMSQRHISEPSTLPSSDNNYVDHRSIEIRFVAIGIGIQLTQLEQENDNASGSRPRSREHSYGSMVRNTSATSTIASLDGDSSLKDGRSRSAGSLREGSTAYSPSPLPLPSPSPSAYGVNVLAIMADVQATYNSVGSLQSGSLILQGLRAETRRIADIRKELASRADPETSLSRHRKLQGTMQSVILYPCKVSLDFKLESQSRTDLTLAITDVKISLSLPVLNLVTSLSTSLLEPVMQPQPDAPLRAVSQFDRIWSFTPRRYDDQELAVSLATTGAAGGLTVWHPHSPSAGYGITGHIITPGDGKPAFEVIMVAINSGLAAYPVEFEKIWTQSTVGVDSQSQSHLLETVGSYPPSRLTIWRPVPPESYVAMGDVVTIDGSRPAVTDVLCIHTSATVQVPWGECLYVDTIAGTFEGSFNSNESSDLELWCVDNSMGTFFCAPPGAPPPGQYPLDLRSPLGVPPATLYASFPPQSTQNDSLKLFQHFIDSRRQRRKEMVRRTLTPTIVDFERVLKTPEAGFWRPVAPPGHLTFGDCAISGASPPRSVLVVNMDHDGNSGNPVVLPSLGYEMLPRPVLASSNDEPVSGGGTVPSQCLCFWKPIAPEGYVAVGYVLTVFNAAANESPTGPTSPVACVRSDAVEIVRPLPSTKKPTCSLFPSLPVPIRTADDSIYTFVVGSSQNCYKLVIDKLDTIASGHDGNAKEDETSNQGNVDIVVAANRISILLLDDLNTPLLEAEAAGVDTGVHGPERSVVQAYLGLRLEVAAYDARLRCWEPVLEATDIISKCDINLGAKPAHGLDPGIRISIKSSAEMVYSSIAVGHVISLLSALGSWHAQQNNINSSSSSTSWTDSSLTTTVVNALGIDAAIEIDHGNRMEMVNLPAGRNVVVVRPLPSHPARRKLETYLSSRDNLPHDTVLFDVDRCVVEPNDPVNCDDLDLVNQLQKSGARLYCAIQFAEDGVDNQPPLQGGRPPRSRAVGCIAEERQTEHDNLYKEGSRSQLEFVWKERLVLALPTRPKAITSATVEIWNAEGDGGRGQLLAKANYQIVVDDIDVSGKTQAQTNKKPERKSVPFCITAVGTNGGSFQVHGTHEFRAGWRARSDLWLNNDLDLLGSGVGQRAVSLASDPGTWVVVPEVRRTGASNTDENLIALHVGTTNVVLESKYRGEKKGGWYEEFRSPCRLVNSTEYVLWVRISDRTLGKCAPGRAIPLPLSSLHDPSACKLAIRPLGGQIVMEDDYCYCTEDGVKDNDTLECDDKEGEKDDGMAWSNDCILNLKLRPGTVDAPRVMRSDPGWFAQVTTSAEIVGPGQIIDVKITITPALMLINRLPMPCGVILWQQNETVLDKEPREEEDSWQMLEEAQGHRLIDDSEIQKELMARATERLFPGEELPVYSVDVARPVHLTLYPDGYDWAQGGPAPLSPGPRDGAPQRAGGLETFMERVLVTRPGAKTGVYIHLERQQHTSGLGSTIMFYAPLWIVNTSNLAIEAAVVDVASADASPLASGADAAGKDGASSVGPTGIRVIRTSDVVRASDSSRGRSVAPHSVELFGPDIVSNKVRQYGVKIKVAGSGWTAPLGWGRGQEDQKDAEKEGSNSFLLRADASDYGVTYEVVGRLETGPFVASRVLRIEPRLVMSNHSRVNIELALCLGNAYQTLTVPPGARGVSCHFPRGNSNAALRVLRFRRSLQSHTGSDLVANQSPWSRPLEVEAGVEEQHHILLSSPYETLDSQPSVLRVSIQARGVGTIHVILESVGPLWPVLVENRTSIQLEYKVPIGRRLTQSRSLSPWSCVGYAEERIKLLSSDQQGQQGDADSEETSKSYELGNQAHLEVKDTLTTAQGPCDVVLGYVHNLVTTPAGVGNVPGEGGGLGIGGAVLGRGGADVALRVLETSQPYSSSPRVLSLSNLHDWKGKEEVSIVVEVPGLEVSLLDDGPAGKREIVCLTVIDLNTSMAWGSIPQGRFRLARMSVRRLQLDDQMAGTRYPVVVSAAKDSKGIAAMLTAAGVLQVTTGSRGRTFFPFIGAQCPEGVQLAISERLVWKLADMVGRLGDVIASINRIDNKEQEQEEADFPIQIRHLSMGDIVLDVSFQGDPSARRPSQLAGGLVGRVIDLASFQAARVIIHGLDRSGIKTVRTALMEELASWFRGELIGAAWSLVRNFGVIGGASRFFGLLSAGVARLSEPGVRQASLTYKERDSQEVGRREGKDDRAASEKGAIAPSTSQLPSSKATASESRAALAARPSQRRIADVGDGLLEGAGAFGSSLMRGVRGLVEKPLQGARATGIGGAVRGAAAGLVGVVSNPVSGALDALSATAEGFDAKFASKAREERLVYARRRLPRVVSGDGRILPIVREGSDREAVVEQLGQALLWATLETKEGEADQSQVEGEGSFEAYEEHFVLPDDVVAVLTTRNLFAIKAPGFARLEGAAEIGMLTVADVGAGTIVWRVTWDDVLAMELRWGGEERYPDRIVIHRKGARRTSSTTSSRANLAQGTSSRSLPLAVMLQCFPGTPQASQLKIVAEKVLRKYYRDPVRHDVLWSERHAARAALPSDQPPDHLPTSLPSLDFELEWHTNPARSPVIHFWRPVAPPGYKPVGDVATLDGEAPVHPVPCFRDDTVLRAARLSGDEGMAVLDETHSRSLPTIAPVEFTLIWRFNGARPVSFWMPVAPEGYVALGAVVVGQAERPNVDEYVCVREDLTVPSRVYDSPIWAFDPVPGILAAKTGGLRNEQSSNERKALAEALARSQNPEAWKVAVWPVDNRLGTFLVVRALSKPPAEIARGVEEVEQRGSKLDKYVV